MPRQVGLKPNFTIIDTDDQLRLIKQIIQAEGLDSQKWPSRVVHGIIERWKDRGLTPDKVSAGRAGGGRRRAHPRHLPRIPAAPRDPERLRLRRPAAAQRRPVQKDAGDPGALPAAVPLHPGRRIPGHQRGAVSVAAAAGAGAIAISAWSATTTSRSMAGAAPRSRTSCSFEHDFPGAKVIRLEQNYRSTPHILAAASGLIAQNDGRLGKTLWTERGRGREGAS